MKKIALLASICMPLLGASAVSVAESQQHAAGMATKQAECPAFLQQNYRKLHSEQTIDLCQATAGKTVLIVNTASNCGFTPQFKSLEAVHKKYQDQGLVVIGFPADNFFQEEDEEKDTAEVCFVNYGVTFTMLQTTSVRGDDANPVFKHLADKTTAPKWNFYKYLVSDNGKKIQHFNSRVKPDDKKFVDALESALKS